MPQDKICPLSSGTFLHVNTSRDLVARLLCTAFLCMCLGDSAAYAQSCVNPVACENLNTGNTGWDPGPGDPSIQGFATDISVNVGQTVFFKVSTPATSYRLEIYRMGYYGGAGARRLATINPSAALPQLQPACLTDSTTRLHDCGNWAVSASWPVPATAVSGLYFANLIRGDTGATSQVFWVVRNDASHSDVLFQTSDQTWAAYNDYAGNSLYGGAGTFDLNSRAFKVSYNRPYDTRNFEAATFLYSAEYPMIRWLEANGYDLSYFTGVDAARNAGLIANHKLYMMVGHDEYVSLDSRTNIQAARNAGVNLAFFSGNEVFWKTRWENSIDGSNTPFRTMVCYKETYKGTGTLYVQDPMDPPVWTGTWADPSSSPPADGGRPQNAMSGTLFKVNGPGPDNTNLSILVPAADGKMRFWRNTSVATLTAGQVATLPGGTLGYEWDADVDNFFRPAGLVPLSTSTYALTGDLLLDYGATYGVGNATHHLSLYRAPSGALVFGAGTVQWSWGLDGNHDGSGGAPDVRMQQATVNMLADMGAQPGNLQTGLAPATKSTDTTPPATSITAPVPGTNLQYGSPITISGTATDSGGGVVGVVEVSVDVGRTWHPATGREQWSFTWGAESQSGTATVMARAADDIGNLQPTPTSATYGVTGAPACPCSVWSSSQVPGTPSTSDSVAVELGMEFRSDVAGFVTAVRFYKGANNSGTHTGSLWTTNGTRLSTVTFTNETLSGWQQASFPSPVPISAGTTYIVSYFAPVGRYADDQLFFRSGVDSPPLHALAEGVDGGNGRYVYGPSGGFPITTFNSSNYWVDIVFTTSTGFSVSGTLSGGGGATVTLSGAASATVTADSSGNYTFPGLQNGGYTVTPAKTGLVFSPTSLNVTVNGANVTGVNFTATAPPTWSISGNIAGGSGATVTLSGTASATTLADASGNYVLTGLQNGTYVVTPTETGFAFTPASKTVTINGANISGVNFAASQTNSIWNNSFTPANPSENDPASVEIGLKFRSDVAGSVTGVRFYKGSGNTGVHVGNLWSSTGTKLATVTFGGETASGWQQANFSPPAAIPANTTYIISYFAPSGHYAADANFFAATGVDNAPLHALSNGASGGNGVYLYGSAGGFPSNTFSSTNYWVDVVLLPSPLWSISGTITGGASSTVTLSGTASATTTADTSGNFSFTGLSNGPYTVTPSKTGFTFTPVNAAVTVNGANITGVNFTANAIPTWSISGTITGGASSTVTLTGTASATTTADASGNFTFTGLSNGPYTVTPSKTGFTFTPVNTAVTVNGANITGVNFTANATLTFSISGTITGGGGSTVTLSGAASAVVTADGTGNFTFAGLANGSYTVTPSKTGFTFTPVNAAVTVSGANVSGVAFTAKAAIAVDAKVFVDGATASLTVSASPVSTTAANELVLAFIATDWLSGPNTTVSSVAGAGLTWALVIRTNTQRGTAEIWRAFATAPLTSATVTATLSQSVISSMTVMSFTGTDPSGTNGAGAIGATGTGHAATGAPTATLVTTRNNSLVVGVGNDFDNGISRTAGTGQTVVHQDLTPTGDTYWVQMRSSSTPASGTSVTINDTAPTTDQYNLSICEILQAP
jgi:hypothetical protein